MLICIQKTGSIKKSMKQKEMVPNYLLYTINLYDFLS